MPPTLHRLLMLPVLLVCAVVPAQAVRAQPFDLRTDGRLHVDLQFEPLSAELTVQTKDELRQLVDRLNLRGSSLIRLNGHADTAAAEPAPLALQRARAAQSHLWQLGVYPRLILVAEPGSVPAQPPRSVRVQSENFTGPLQPSMAGLHFMGWWVDEALLGKRPLPKSAPPQPTPYDILPQVEPALRPRFIRLMQLAAIKNQDDEWLVSLRAMDDGSRTDTDPLPPALYAQVFGSARAQAMTQADAANIPAADPRRLALAQRVWCSDNPLTAFSRLRMDIMEALLPAQQVLQNLPGPQQLAWIGCAQHSAQDLRWLSEQQGVSLDTKRQPDGWTPLHAAVRRGDEQAVAALLRAGANPRTSNGVGDTPLHLLAHPDHPLLPSSVQQHMRQQLLAAGANRDALDRQGQPARPSHQPLPPKDERIADQWPPGVKRRVDNLLALFRSRTKAPAPAEIMSLLDVELREIQIPPNEATRIAILYGVHSGEPGSAQPTAWRSNFTPHYIIFTRDAKGWQSHSINMPVSSPKFCLNPYELAIYTGASFLDATGPTQHANPGAARQGWEYARDMFKRSASNTFWADGFSISTSAVRHPQTGAVTDEGCVRTMGVGGSFAQ